MRILALAALFIITLQSTAFAGDVAIGDQMANPRPVASGKILGAQNFCVDTYGINLAQADGVKTRDVYEIRRHDKKVGEVMVVFVAQKYSLVTLRSGGAALQAGDKVVYSRHVDVPVTPVKFVPQETVWVTERNFYCSRVIPSGSFASSVSFAPGQIGSFSSSVSYSPSQIGSFSSTVNYSPNISFGSPFNFGR